MPVQNGERLATKQDLADMYQGILPYLGGSADAGFTPIGTIIPMIAKDAPANYLKCNGATYNKSDYPELAAHLLSMPYNTPYIVSGDDTKFKVPDLRGEFLRGISTNGHTGEGNGARVGEHQAGTEIPYNMLSANGSRSNGFMNSTGTTQQGRINVSADKLGGSPDKIVQIVTTEGTLPSGQYEYYKVRPTNTSVLFCIATKNIYLNPSLDYSTDEKVVGSWIDGKTIYQRTIQTTSPVPSSDGTLAEKYIDLGVNIDSAVNVISIRNSNHAWSNFPLTNPLNASSVNYTMMAFVYDNSASNNANKLRLTNNSSAWANIPVYVTIQYTKTTGT